MGLIRIALLAVAAFLIYSFIRSVLGGGRRTERAAERSWEDERLNRLVPCAQCNLYVDSKEALPLRGADEPTYFCSEECRTAWREAERAKTS